MTEVSASELDNEEAFTVLWGFVMGRFGGSDEDLEAAVIAMRTASAIIERELNLPPFEVEYLYKGEEND